MALHVFGLSPTRAQVNVAALSLLVLWTCQYVLYTGNDGIARSWTVLHTDNDGIARSWSFKGCKFKAKVLEWIEGSNPKLAAEGRHTKSSRLKHDKVPNSLENVTATPLTRDAPSLPRLPHNATGRAFVCITGQVKRFVGLKIKETILDPLKKQGYEIDVALVMSEESLYSTNVGKSSWRWNRFDSYHDAHAFVISSGFHVVTNESIAQLRDPLVPPNYLNCMDKANRSEDKKRERAQNHARQFKTLTKCNDMLLRGLPGVPTGMSSTRNKFYDFAIRLREDVSLDKPLRVDDLLPLLYPRSGSQRTVLGTDCRTHGGINDRLAFLSRGAFRDYFIGPWKYFSESDGDLNASANSIHNPESFLYYVYHSRLNMNVIRTPKLRGVIKYVVRNKGSEEHPRLLVEPASRENETMCHWDGSH